MLPATIATALILAQSPQAEEPWKSALAPGYAEQQDTEKRQAAYDDAVQRETYACLNSPTLVTVRQQCAAQIGRYGERARGATCIQNEQDINACPARARAMVDAAAKAQAGRKAALEEQGRHESARRQFEADQENSRAELASDPKQAAQVLSAFVCHNLAIRAEEKKEIDDERKYAREGGGVVDLAKIHENQDGMRLVDEKNMEIVTVLKRRYGRRPLPCGATAKELAPEAQSVIDSVPESIVADLGEHAPWFLAR
jgi:hypothetical protein